MKTYLLIILLIGSASHITLQAAQQSLVRSSSSNTTHSTANMSLADSLIQDAIFSSGSQIAERSIYEEHKENEFSLVNGLPDRTPYPETLQSKPAQTAENAPLNILSLISDARNNIKRPQADTNSITPDLKVSVLQNCPSEITEVIALLQNREGIDDKIVPKKLIFCGPPGTGKTTLGKAIAAECAMPFFLYRASSIANEYKDSGTNNLRKIFQDAALLGKPCVIIVDELEILFKRHENKNDTESGMLQELWSLIDSYEKYPILFVGTCNDISKAQIQMEDRFAGSIIEVPLPPIHVREKLIQYHLESYKHLKFDSSISVTVIAHKTEGFSHRKLHNLFAVAARIAHARDGSAITITKDDCLKALHIMQKETNKTHAIQRRANFIKFMTQWAPQLLVAGVGLGFGIYTHHQAQNFQKENIALQKQMHELQIQSQKLQKDSLDQQNSNAYNSLIMSAGVTVFNAIVAWLIHKDQPQAQK